MIILEPSVDSAKVILSVAELTMLNNAMNEVANGVHIPDWEFSTRLGCRRDEIKALLDEIHALLQRMEPSAEPG